MMEFIIISAIWCPSCLVMKKVYKQLESDFHDITFSYLDYDFDEDEVLKYNVSNILPVVILKKDNMEIKRIIGEHNKAEYEKVIKECYEK